MQLQSAIIEARYLIDTSFVDRLNEAAFRLRLTAEQDYVLVEVDGWGYDDDGLILDEDFEVAAQIVADVWKEAFGNDPEHFYTIRDIEG